jgi:hypothetical protein
MFGPNNQIQMLKWVFMLAKMLKRSDYYKITARHNTQSLIWNEIEIELWVGERSHIPLPLYLTRPQSCWHIALCRTVLLTGIFEHYYGLSESREEMMFFPADLLFNMYVFGGHPIVG